MRQYTVISDTISLHGLPVGTQVELVELGKNGFNSYRVVGNESTYVMHYTDLSIL